jgi:hypothetical protein
MATPKKPPAPKRTRYTVIGAALCGTNWEVRQVSKTLYPMDSRFCHDLSYWLNKRLAYIIGPAKSNGEGWTNIVCWPGRGVFVATIVEEAE